MMNFLPLCKAIIQHQRMSKGSYGFGAKNNRKVDDSAGNTALISDFSLKGDRTYGDDCYTGTYTADYKDFSKTEYLFGGTSIKRENGKDISVSCDLEITEGTAQVFWISGSDEPVILLEATDSYSETITLPEGGNYIGITGNNFTVALENKAAVFWKIKMEWVKSGGQ